MWLLQKIPRVRLCLKMTLTESLQRTLLLLFATTIFVLLILYWNQGHTSIPINVGNIEKYSYDLNQGNGNSKNTAKMWTYKCEGDKCVRYFYSKSSTEKRIAFMTCSMTCGEVNVWPYPTLKVAVSSKSLKFLVDDIKLYIKTPYTAVEKLFRNVFNLFLNDLRQIHRVNSINAEENIDSDRPRSNHNKEMRNPKELKENDNDNAVGSMFSKAFGALWKLCDVDSFAVNVNIHKFGYTNLNLDTDESYQLSISHSKRSLNVYINASSYFGARHGLSTLQQLIWFDDEDNFLRILSRAIIKDAPKFKYRGLMLDTSRHYFSVESIKRTIVAMSHAKLNRFHWHITDSQSFPFISKFYPELSMYGAYSPEETYTTEDIHEVTQFAKLHGVQIVPEIDAPAHAGNGWDWGPKHGLGELSLCINQQPWSFYCGEPPCGQLNPKNNNTYLILQRLYEELIGLTESTDYFHLGGDEVNLECWNQYFNDTDLRDLWCDFMLNAVARLKIANNNVTPRVIAVWSSGLTNTKCLSRNQFAVQVWGGSTWQENYDLIDNGFNVIFSHVDAWYLDCGFGNWRSTGEAACSPYRTWQNVYKHRPWKRMRLDAMKKKQVLGGEVCLWTEQVDENQLDNRLWPRSAALSERLWSDPDDDHELDMLSQVVFKRMSIFRNRLVELGIKAEPIFPKYCAQNPGECI